MMQTGGFKNHVFSFITKRTKIILKNIILQFERIAGAFYFIRFNLRLKYIL